MRKGIKWSDPLPRQDQMKVHAYTILLWGVIGVYLLKTGLGPFVIPITGGLAFFVATVLILNHERWNRLLPVGVASAVVFYAMFLMFIGWTAWGVIALALT